MSGLASWRVRFRVLLALLALGVVGSPACHAYVASAEFDTVNNPSSTGLWKYGYTAALGGSFLLYAFHIDHGAIQGWGGFTSSDGNPSAQKNTTNARLTYFTGFWEPFGITLHPGTNGEFSVLRFTAPVSGVYRVEASFANADETGTSTDVHVLINGTPIYDGGIGGVGGTAGTTQLVNLLAGDTADLAVGRGANQSFLYDTTAVELRMTPVPEPESPVALLLGTLVLRRKLVRR